MSVTSFNLCKLIPWAGKAPLTAVQLLWVNLIMDTLGALALATEPPYDELMDKEPVGRKGTLITVIMWRNIFGQAIYQLAVLWQLQSKGKMFLHLNEEDAEDVLNTMIFNTFVFCQVTRLSWTYFLTLKCRRSLFNVLSFSHFLKFTGMQLKLFSTYWRHDCLI